MALAHGFLDSVLHVERRKVEDVVAVFAFVLTNAKTVFQEEHWCGENLWGVFYSGRGEDWKW